MHELSLCRAIAGIAAEHAGGRVVERVHVDVGHLRQVVPDTLRYSWDLVVADTGLDGAELVVNHVAAAISCPACGATTAITVPVFRCPCGSTDVTVVSGEELLVTALDLADG